MYVAPGLSDRLMFFGGILFLIILVMIWSKAQKNNKKIQQQPPATFSAENEIQASPNSGDAISGGGLKLAESVAERTVLSIISWALLLLSAVLSALSLLSASNIPNSGYIADLQTQTNEVLFAVVVALVSIAAGIAALFLRLSAMLPNKVHPKV